MILVGLSLNVSYFLVILSVSEIFHRTYAVLYSKGLLQSLRSFAMTSNFASSFGGSVGKADDRGFSVILSVSEISHRTYAVLYSKGLPQSLRSFAMTSNFASSFGGNVAIATKGARPPRRRSGALQRADRG